MVVVNKINSASPRVIKSTRSLAVVKTLAKQRSNKLAKPAVKKTVKQIPTPTAPPVKRVPVPSTSTSVPDIAAVTQTTKSLVSDPSNKS